MTKEARFDVIYTAEGPRLDYHFCREWGCYGTNPDHGYSLDEACDDIATHYERIALSWRDKTNEELEYFLKEIGSDVCEDN